ncbi:MAG: hypothetical protein BWK79_08045 [Beggiatoa sp. IS2]|nr:MAG: hypothetical protein BWK79_08045 [Beggiatoa sp. IS2]
MSTHFGIDLPAGSVHDVYETLERLATHESLCRKNLKELVEKSGYCQRTVQRSLRILEKQGYVRIKQQLDKRNKLINVYYLIPLI